MNKPFKNMLVISDLDGTLLTKDMTISTCDIEAIKLFCMLGGKFTVATGRSIEAVRPYVNQLFINTPAILYNGALIYDFQKERALYAKFLPIDAIDAIKHFMKAFPEVGSEVMTEDYHIYFTNATQYTYMHAFEESLNYLVKDFRHIKQRLFKALFTCDAVTHRLLIKEAKYLTHDGFYFVPTSDHYFELMPAGVSKGNALKILCDELLIPIKNTVAVGDYYNDIDLFKAANYSVAMGNAPQDIKNIANEVTASVESGGVGHFLYEFINKHHK